MEPIDYLRALRARWRLIVLSGLIGLVAAWVTTPAAPPPRAATIKAYTARHTLVTETTVTEGAPVDLSRVALLVRTGDVPKRVVGKLGLAEEPVVVASRVSAIADPQARSIALTVTDTDAQRAKALADAFATETMAYLAEREQARFDQQAQALSKEIVATQARYAALDARLASVPEDRKPIALAERNAVLNYLSSLYQRSEQLVATGPRPSGLVTLEEATPVPIAEAGFQPPASRTGRMLIAGPFGLLLGAGLALLLKRIDPRITSKEEAEASFGLPVVAEVPVLPWLLRRHRYHVASASDELSPVAEAYRLLRTSVRLMPVVTATSLAEPPVRSVGGERRQVLLVTSPGPGEGKTTTVANLAASFANQGESVLVIDFDIRRPEIHRYLGVAASAPSSVPSLPIRAAELDALAVRTAIPGVRVMQGWTGTGAGRELLDEGRSLIAAARQIAEVVILDTPPLLATNHASELIPFVDAAVVACRSHRTSTEAGNRTAEVLARLGARLVGVVLIGAPTGVTPRRYYGHLYASPEVLKEVGRSYHRSVVDKATSWAYRILVGKSRSTTTRASYGREEGGNAPSPAVPRVAPWTDDGEETSSAPASARGGRRG